MSDAVRAELRASYERCLCRKCLESFADEKKSAASMIHKKSANT